MDFDPVCVDDRRTVVCRAQDRAGEGTGYPRQLRDRGSARTCLLVRMGGVHTACDGLAKRFPLTGPRFVPHIAIHIVNSLMTAPLASVTEYFLSADFCGQFFA